MYIFKLIPCSSGLIPIHNVVILLSCDKTSHDAACR
uniref:Uncharacterized protein n=1 Tax=Rhizophora mucronata TaxID=61149 RepID=A0A2P2IRJ8_RHIMU